jgi:predicted transcriptional regulator
MGVSETSIDCFYGHVVPVLAQPQQIEILAAMDLGRDYSLSEISRATGIEKSTVSARVNSMKSAGLVEHGPARKCSITGITIKPVRKPRGPQLGLPL